MRLLHDEGVAIPLNFESELRPLKAAIGAAEQWAEEHHTVLESLGITDTDADAGAEDVDGGDESHASEMTVKVERPTDESQQGLVEGAIAAPPTLSYRDFAKIVSTASQLVVDFSLVR